VKDGWSTKTYSDFQRRETLAGKQVSDALAAVDPTQPKSPDPSAQGLGYNAGVRNKRGDITNVNFDANGRLDDLSKADGLPVQTEPGA
jgi:hypothetical protein